MQESYDRITGKMPKFELPQNGVKDISPTSSTDNPLSGPKYRRPTKEEADQHIADTKAMMTIGATVLGASVGGVPGALVGGGAKAASEHFSPKIERHIRNSEWVPVYDNWTENDFHNEYGGR